MAGEAKPKETAEARFKRVASLRVSKALDAIDRIGKVSGPHTEAQVSTIQAALTKAVSDTVAALTASIKGGRPTASQRFTL